MSQRRVVRVRWGVVMRTARTLIWTGLLGTGWHPDWPKILPDVDYWPMSFETRREARVIVGQMGVQHASFGAWLFRVVRLTITTEIHP